MTALAEQTDGSYEIPDVLWMRMEARTETGKKLEDEELLASCEMFLNWQQREGLAAVLNAVKKDGVEVWFSCPPRSKEAN